MGLEKSKAIVLKSTKYSETSLILDLYTQDFGLIKSIVSGIRSSKSKSKANKFQPMSILEVIFYYKTTGSLCRIKESATLYVYQKIQQDVIRTALGTLMIELTGNAIKEEEKNKMLFDFIISWFQFLDQSDATLGLIPLKYMIEFSRHLGFEIENNYSDQNMILSLDEGKYIATNNATRYEADESCSRAISLLKKCAADQLYLLKIDKETRKNTLANLLDYYKLHLEHFRPLKSLEILSQILG